ncbi:hypothetical protein AIOL_000673 [Candidatus Rhodobacter oscarellae]|uniref:Uncharacterized protein n=1 Tax=Candidatus Rhodobacter oscarellae TaxID=1675527 RepID=A0A0J9ECL1_9RHOB|nr:hypothetical protein [Candidatus Rhodobacter lobularis]KMW60517.1 hypothetical protein AIOL_000673 [Candidatus Rhodobacter lobularis]
MRITHTSQHRLEIRYVRAAEAIAMAILFLLFAGLLLRFHLDTGALRFFADGTRLQGGEAGILAAISLALAACMVEYGSVVVDHDHNLVRSDRHTLISRVTHTVKLHQLEHAKVVRGEPCWIELTTARGESFRLQHLPSGNQEVYDVADAMNDWLSHRGHGQLPLQGQSQSQA